MVISAFHIFHINMMLYLLNNLSFENYMLPVSEYFKQNVAQRKSSENIGIISISLLNMALFDQQPRKV